MSNATLPRPVAPQEGRAPSPFKRWLLEGYIDRPQAAHAQEHQHHPHPWWKVMCLTGVDYFSTLGYQPGLAALAAGALSPVATFVLVLLTLFGALPIYSRVARESPNGEGSIAMLEGLLKWWQGKLFVLALLGFVATDFIITITLSTADATAHVVENPYAPHALHGQEVGITLFFIALLGAVFLKGFKEAINIAVVLVAIYLVLNAVVVARGLYELFTRPELLQDWQTRLLQGRGNGNPLLMVGFALLLFPKLALGLSGFETGVAVMPLVKGNANDTPQQPEGRIVNTRKLLLVAALIMSVFLLASSVITTLIIPPEAFYSKAKTPEAQEALRNLASQLGRPVNTELVGQAYGRALAYLAHGLFSDSFGKSVGNAFGTLYDISTIAILWFAGASAMAGLLNIVPRYLPRYGMAPEWTRASRPLVLIFIATAFLITIIFRANVEAQGGAYATGVLVLMTSAAVAVTISAFKRGAKGAAIGFGIIALVFLYTTGVNVYERPDGMRIASMFILAIVAVSIASRVWRTLELRVHSFEMDETAQRFVMEAAQNSQELRLLPNHRDGGDKAEYDVEIRDAREDHDFPDDDPILIVEVEVRDASEFAGAAYVTGVEIGGHRILRVQAVAIPNGIAALMLHLRDITGKRPQAYFNWTEGNPLLYLIRYLLSGQGDIAPVTREILRQAEPDPTKRPGIHAAM